MRMCSLRLLVRNFDNCFDFYSKVMGFKVTWGKKGEAYASFDVGGGAYLGLFQLELNNDFLGITNAPYDPNLRAEDKAILCFESDDVDQACQDLKNKGATLLVEPVDMPGWGIRCANLRDPEGNLLEISTPMPIEEWNQDLKEQGKEFEWEEKTNDRK